MGEDGSVCPEPLPAFPVALLLVERAGIAALAAAGVLLAASAGKARSAAPVPHAAVPLPSATSAVPFPGAPAAPVLAAPSAPPARPPHEPLAASIQRRLAFPFQPDCQGNTQEIVACLWQRRDRQDQRLATLLGSAEVLEEWRAARAAVCRRSAERGSGGSIQPILGLGCENALNATLILQTAGPLLR